MADLGSIPALKAAIAGRIFPNTTFEVSAKDVDDSFIDTIDTLKAQLTSFNNTTYGDLVNNYNNQTLVPGAFYAFTYEHKYVLDMASSSGSGASGELYNTDVATINEIASGFVASPQAYSAPSETIIVQAVAVNKLAPEAISLSHPQDVIYYDILDNTTEESGATAGNRTGFIHYREDPINNIKADFDWRSSIGYVDRIEESILGKQFTDNPVLAVNNQAPASSADIVFGAKTSSVGTLTGVTFGTRHYFRMLGGFQNESVTAPANTNYKNIEIGRADGFIAYGSVYGAGRVPNITLVCINVSDVKIGRDCSNISIIGFNASNVNIGARCGEVFSSASFLNPGDAITANTLSAGSVSFLDIGDGCRNVFVQSAENLKIGNSCTSIDITGAAYRSEIKNQSSSISVIDGVFHLEIGQFCQDIISWASSADIGDGSSNITLIHSGAGVDNQCVIGKNCDDLILTHCFTTKMGVDNFNLRLYALTDCEIGNANQDLYLKDAFNCEIGNRNELIELVSQSGSVKVGSDNVNLRLEVDSVTVGNNNQNIYFIDPITDGVLGDHNTSILLFQSNDISIGSRNTNIFMNTCFGVTVGDQCDRITIEGASDVKIGDGCTRVSRGEYPIFVIPSFAISKAFRGTIWSTSINADEMFDGTQYVSFSQLMNIFGRRILGIGAIAPTVANISVGNNCENILLSGGNDIVVSDGVANVFSGHEVDFADINDLDVTLVASNTATEFRLAYQSSKAGIATTGGRVVTLDELVTAAVNTEMAAPADIGITANDYGGDANVIYPGKEDIKLRERCSSVIVDASEVDLDTISDVKIEVPVTIPSGATGPSGAVIDLKSPDGKAWYETIDNAGSITRAKYE